MGSNIERINDVALQLQNEIRANFDEPEAIVRGDDVDAFGGNALSTKDSEKLIKLLCEVPNGVQAWSQDIEGLVQTSLNLGVALLDKEGLRLTFAVRSSVNQEKRELLQRLRDLADVYGGSYSQMGDYPAWEYKKESHLRDTMVKTYRDMFGAEPQVVAIHAGLECGLLSEKLPGLDCVSMGPNMHDIHTSRETLEIESTKRTWEFLLAILKAL
jgi:dipeptidase D